MQFSRLAVLAAAFAGAQAAVEFTNSAFNNITAGEPFTFTWTGASGPVTLTLKDGASTDLKTVSVISSGLSGESYTWDVPATLTADTYAVEIQDSTSTPNYSTQFQLIGGVAASSSSSSAAASSTSSSAASSSTGSSTSSASSSTITSSSSANSTTTTSGSSSSTHSASKTTTTSSSSTTSSEGSTSSTSAPSSASGLASPLALVFLAFAAILTLN